MRRVQLPGLIGMLITGMLFGPYTLDFVHHWVLDRSSDFRLFALMVILLRAGLTLNIQELRKIGRSVILMSLIPPSLEILLVTLIAPIFFPISYLDAAIMGTVLSAVSPAIVVPRMIMRMNKSQDKLPQLMIASTAINGVIAIIVFSILLGFEGVGANPSTIMRGVILPIFIVLCGIIVKKRDNIISLKITQWSRIIWFPTEIILFVLVGASLDMQYLTQTGGYSIVIIVLAVMVRMGGVMLSLMKETYTMKERLYCAISYVPKATVQATIGGTALALGLAAGQVILVVAVLSIIITAPIGAMLMDRKWFTKHP